MHHRSRHIVFVPTLLGLAALAASPLSMNDENENFRQLQTMPRERRVALLENLATFDKLGPADQAMVRTLNAEIARKDPFEQVKYRSVMRRYQLWYNGLNDDQKKSLQEATDPDTRFNLAVKYRKEQQATGSAAQRVHGIRTGYFGLKGPFQTAQLLRIWQKMSLAQKNQIENHGGPGRLEDEIHEMNKQLLVRPHSFPQADEKHYEALIEADDDFKKQIGLVKIEAEKVKKPDASMSKADQEKAKAEVDRAKKAQAFQMRTEAVFAQFLYFEDPAHKPRPVKQENLEKFSAFCPAWFHAMIDPLSADDARNYLTIVYRLLFPEGSEINDDWKPARAKAPIAPGASRPTPKRSGSPTSF